MQLVIDIDEETYKKYKKCKWKNNGVVGLEWWERAIINGIPLPKGHGDLKDINEIKALGNHRNMTCTFEDIDDATTVLEADKDI